MPRPAFKRAFDHCTEYYARHRPPYPRDAFQLLAECTPPEPHPRAADVGAGTGIFARQLARAGWCVIAVEPSENMLQWVAGANDELAPGDIRCICATAENTALANRSVSA